jgi:chromosome segregation ATPase
MSETAGRSEFLAAAMALRKAGAFLEARRKDVDLEIDYYRAAEQSLVILADADQVRNELLGEIQAARDTLASLHAGIEKLRSNLSATQAECAAAAEDARKKTEGVIAQRVEAQHVAVERIRELEESVAVAERETSEKLAALDGQITEKEAVLASIREHIAKIAGM